MTKEVAPVEETGSALAVMEGMEDMLLADAGAGSENIGLEHLTVPFFSILQQLSPQVQKGGPAYIAGAEAGMIMNTLTKEVYKANVGEKGGGILVAAVHFDPKAIEWKPRGQAGGGGLVRVWGDDTSYMQDPARYQFSKEKNRWISVDGTEISDHYDTFVTQLGHFGSADDFEELTLQMSQGILSCKGSQIKKAKAWNAERVMRRIQVGGKTIQPAAWFQTYRIQTRFESNDKGSWFGWEITPYKPILELPSGRDLYALCKETSDKIRAGDLKADEATRLASEGSGEGGGEPLPTDIPF